MATISIEAARALVSRVPKVLITSHGGLVLEAPVTLFMTMLRGKPVRAGDLRPGQMIAFEYTAMMGYRFDTVERVVWPSVPEAQRNPDFRRAAGSAICEMCGCTYYDHPEDRRYPDLWQPGASPHYSLTILCNADLVKL